MRTAIITGASGGIGSCIAEFFSRAGYRVVATDISEPKCLSNNITFRKADLRAEEEIKELFSFVKQSFGAAHVLVNCAAISNFSKPLNELSSSEFDNVISVNLRGSFLCCKEFVDLNKGEDYGRIINISSTRFNQNERDWEAYGASKGAVVSLTNSLCVSLSDTPITVNAISPGWIQTNDYDQLTDSDHKQHPSGRVGKPEDVARTCLFICEEHNDFLNGANIVIDGGMTKRMIYF